MKKLFALALVPALAAVLWTGPSAQAQSNETAAVGATAPAFTLTDLNGQEHSLQQYLDEGKVVVLEWFNPDCPFVVKHHANGSTMRDLAAAHSDDVVWLAINSGAEGKQGAGLERNQRAAEEYGITYPILLDMSGEVGRTYGARTTPHMYVINAEGTLVYAGAIDNNRHPRQFGDTNYVSDALDAVLAGEDVATAQTQPYGCGVKY